MDAFADFIAPLSPEAFFRDVYGQRPVHIQADDDRRRALLPWARFNELLAIGGVWTAARMKLVRDNVPIGPEHYTDLVRTPDGARQIVDPAKAKVLLSLGASLIADEIQAVSPEVRAAGAVLGDRLGGAVGANAYCSFKSYRGFGAHFDLHEVFAVHTEGEKTWRIYEGRADNPIAFPASEDDDEVRRWFDATKGALLFEARMRPGDVIYIPRGWYHEAVAHSQASLHLTFSVAPHTGRVLFQLLEREALLDSAFRAYLPDGDEDGGAALAARLGELGRKLAALATSPELMASVLKARRTLRAPSTGFGLPATEPLNYYRRTQRPAQVQRRDGRAVLVAAGAEHGLEPGLHEAASWALQRPAFALAELKAHFRDLPAAEVEGLVALLHRGGLVERI